MSDLIDRGALGIGKCNPSVFTNNAYGDGWNACIDIIENAPAVDAIPLDWFGDKRDNLFIDALINGNVYGDKSIEKIHALNCVLEMWDKDKKKEKQHD